jgi:hypothetical protein
MRETPDDVKHRGTLWPVSFGPEAIRGARSTGTASGPRSAQADRGGQVTYRLARNAVVSEFQKGRLSRLDVCDAHPELIRAARSVGETTTELCPICEERDLTLVSYAFGPGLPRSGKLISSAGDLTRAAKASTGEVACYVVKVCPGCSWNHLSRTYAVSSRRRSSKTGG